MASAEDRLEKDWFHASGIYPHLAFFNHEGECGTGAVVPWRGRLWAISYAPHRPNGSTDKLYEIDRRLNLTVRSESVGGDAGKPDDPSRIEPAFYRSLRDRQ